MMTFEEHKKKLREILEMVEGVFAKDSKVHPVVFTIKDGALAIYMVASLNDDREKEALSNFMTGLARDGAEAIVFASESWSLSPESIDTYKLYKSIADNPNRIEIVSVIYSTKDGDILASAEIDRNYDPWADDFSKGGECKPVLKPWMIIDEGEKARTEGRFCKFWDKIVEQKAQEWAAS